MWFSLASHANRMIFFVIETLYAALKIPIFNFGLRSIAAKLEEKQKGVQTYETPCTLD